MRQTTTTTTRACTDAKSTNKFNIGETENRFVNKTLAKTCYKCKCNINIMRGSTMAATAIPEPDVNADADAVAPNTQTHTHMHTLTKIEGTFNASFRES